MGPYQSNLRELVINLTTGIIACGTGFCIMYNFVVILLSWLHKHSPQSPGGIYSDDSWCTQVLLGNLRAPYQNRDSQSFHIHRTDPSRHIEPCGLLRTQHGRDRRSSWSLPELLKHFETNASILRETCDIFRLQDLIQKYGSMGSMSLVPDPPVDFSFTYLGEALGTAGGCLGSSWSDVYRWQSTAPLNFGMAQSFFISKLDTTWY